MDCRAFEEWLDGDRPAADREDANAHARECASCAALVTADDAVGSGLRSAWANPDESFTALVMARVASTRRETVPALDAELLLPWWTQVLREPEAMLGLLLGGLYAGAGPWLLPWIRSMSPKVAAYPLPSAGDLGMAWPPVFLVFLLIPLVGASAWLLYRGASAAFARLGSAA